MKNIQSFQFYGMGSQIKLWLQHADEEKAQQLLTEAANIFMAQEGRLSRFLTTSELSELNRQSGEWVQVSEPLFNIMSRAIQLARDTNGRFDPTQLDSLEGMGYGRSFETLSHAMPSSITPTVTKHNFEQIALDPISQAIRCPAGVRIDLGGIGKGFTAQTAVSFLNQYGPCLVDAGGDVTAGDAPLGDPGWPVGIGMPGAGKKPAIARLWLKNKSLATSGVDYRRWTQGGVQRHHIIDPQTAVSAQTDALTVSVVAEDACTAEAWATAALVVGSRDGLALLTAVNLQAAIINKEHQLLMTPQLLPYVQVGDVETAVHLSKI